MATYTGWKAALTAALGKVADITAVEQVTLTGDLAYTLPADVSSNRVHSVVFTQDATGGHTVTYDGSPLDTSVPVMFTPDGAGGYRVGYLSGDGPINARNEGAVGDGVTDDGPALKRAALKAQALGRVLFIPRGNYMTSVTIPWSGVIYGDGMAHTTITGTDPTKPVFATRSWLTEFGGGLTPGDEIRDMRVRYGLHGIVLKSWRSKIRRVYVDYSAQHGIYLTTTNESGASPDASLVGNLFEDVRVSYTGGIPLVCGELDNGKATDGEIAKAVLVTTSTSQHALLVGTSAGWQIDSLHTYGEAPTDATVRLWRCGNTQLGKILVERYSTYALRAQLALGLSVDALNVYTTISGGSLVYLERSPTYPTSAAHFSSITARSDAPFTSIIHNVASACEVKIGAVDVQGEYGAPLASGTGYRHVRVASMPLVIDAGATVWAYDPAGVADGPIANRRPTAGEMRDTWWQASSSIAVAAGKVVMPATTGALLDATMDAGRADGVVSGTYAGGDAPMLVLGRYVSDTNAVYALLSASGTLSLAKRVGSSSGTTIASVSHARVAGDVVSLRMAGTQVSVLVNGTEVIAPQTVEDHVTATRHGVAVTGSTGQSLSLSGVSFAAL